MSQKKWGEIGFHVFLLWTPWINKKSPILTLIRINPNNWLLLRLLKLSERQHLSKWRSFSTLSKDEEKRWFLSFKSNFESLLANYHYNYYSKIYFLKNWIIRTHEQVWLISIKFRNIGASSINACYLLKFDHSDNSQLFISIHISVWISDISLYPVSWKKKKKWEPLAPFCMGRPVFWFTSFQKSIHPPN